MRSLTITPMVIVNHTNFFRILIVLATLFEFELVFANEISLTALRSKPKLVSPFINSIVVSNKFEIPIPIGPINKAISF